MPKEEWIRWKFTWVRLPQGHQSRSIWASMSSKLKGEWVILSKATRFEGQRRQWLRSWVLNLPKWICGRGVRLGEVDEEKCCWAQWKVYRGFELQPSMDRSMRPASYAPPYLAHQRVSGSQGLLLTLTSGSPPIRVLHLTTLPAHLSPRGTHPIQGRYTCTHPHTP